MDTNDIVLKLKEIEAQIAALRASLPPPAKFQVGDRIRSTYTSSTPEYVPAEYDVVAVNMVDGYVRYDVRRVNDVRVDDRLAMGQDMESWCELVAK